MANFTDSSATITKILGSAAIVGVLCGGGAWVVASFMTDAPQRSDFVQPVSTHRGIAEVTIHDPGNVLSSDEESRLKRGAARIEAPEVVQKLHYFVFAKNHENVNDSVEEFLREKPPNLIRDEKFADDTLFVGVGLDPRQAFVFTGEDVAKVLSLYSGIHLSETIDAIKLEVKDNNIPAGLFAGANAATDSASLAESQYQDALTDCTAAMVGAGVGTGGAAFASIAGVGFYRRSRQKKYEEACDNLAFITREYGELGQRLEEDRYSR